MNKLLLSISLLILLVNIPLKYKTVPTFDSFESKHNSSDLFNSSELFETKEYFNTMVSGSEPNYEPGLWNDPQFIKENNCYAYLLNDRQLRPKKPQPGAFAGNKTKDSYKSCSDTFNRVVQDNPRIYMSSADQKCRFGYYKGFLSMDPGRDYHFYRQDKTGYWSHKPGKNPVTNLDSSGNQIMNPQLADKIYKEFQYTKDCNFMCIPNDLEMKTNAK